MVRDRMGSVVGAGVLAGLLVASLGGARAWRRADVVPEVSVRLTEWKVVLSERTRARAGAGRGDHRDSSCFSAPGVTRTPGQRFRKPLLYPPELRGQVVVTTLFQCFHLMLH